MATETAIVTGDAPLVALTPDRRRALTRRHLLEAAGVVFARQGFHGATLDEVAATAGFTKGAVYSNFTSKDDLFLALGEPGGGRDLVERRAVEALAREHDGRRVEQVPAGQGPPPIGGQRDERGVPSLDCGLGCHTLQFAGY